MPVEDERECYNHICSTVIFIVVIMSDDYKSGELPGKSPVCDLNLGEVCSLIIRELDKREH